MDTRGGFGMLKNLSKLKIEKRLSKSFTLVSLITSIAAVIGLIALIIPALTGRRYSEKEDKPI